MSFDVVRSNRIVFKDLTVTRFIEEFQPLVDEASELLKQAGVAESDIRITKRLDMRYRGQGFEVEVLLPQNNDVTNLFEQIPMLFTATYAKIFSVSSIKEPIEIVNFKVEATGPLPEVGGEYRPGEVMPSLKACFTSFISVTVSAISTSRR